jgi:SAM-dependent methyltransferase
MQSTVKKLDGAPWKAQKRPHYVANYERVLQGFLSKQDVRLFEMGVWEGGSLAMWEDYFEQGIIVGLDFRESVLKFGTERIKVYRGGQEDEALLTRIRQETAPDGFDVIIDDCSHLGEFTRASFWHLFENHLKPGGIYVIEDWETGYIEKWRDGKALSKTFRRRYSAGRGALQKFLGKLITIGPVEEFVRKNERWKYLPTFAFVRQRFSSHSYGIVGVVKQLIDEFGIPASQIKPPSWIEKMEICPGQVFIYKKKSLD